MLYFNLLLLFVDTKVRFLIENTSCHSSFFVICNILVNENEKNEAFIG